MADVSILFYIIDEADSSTIKAFKYSSRYCLWFNFKGKGLVVSIIL
uniref:Uncharacterized protein n=1 Tax=Anguilla anguilla TaxID=7936 RepID=A0A0E9TP27_ANGAN